MWSASVSFSCVWGVNSVESWLRVCGEWGVMGVQGGVEGVIGDRQSDGISADTAHLDTMGDVGNDVRGVGVGLCCDWL